MPLCPALLAFEFNPLRDTPGLLRILFWGVMLLFAGVVIVLLIATFFAALFEKRPLSVFVPVEPDEAGSLPESPYLAAMFEAARGVGFPAPVLCRHSKGGTYKLQALTWFSPARDILVVSAAGTMIKVPYRRTLLQTRVGKRLYLTVDEWGTADLSELSDRVTIKNADFYELLAAHEARLESVRHLIRPYTEADPAHAYEVDSGLLAAEMERLGRGKFVDAERKACQYTLKGAAILTMRSIDTMRKSSKDDAARSKRPRPGDPAYESSRGFPVIPPAHDLPPRPY